MLGQGTIFKPENLTEDELEDIGEGTKPDRVTVKTEHHSRNWNRGKQNKQALLKFRDVLESLKGKTVEMDLITGGGFFWAESLKFYDIHYQWGMWSWAKEKDIRDVGVIMLYGRAGAEIRILHPKMIFDVRVQEYEGFTDYLIDFWNGFYGNPIEKWINQYDCLHLRWRHPRKRRQKTV